MKKCVIAVFFLALGFRVAHSFLFTSLVFAHEFEHAEKIGAVIHISDDDDPIVGALSTISIEFKDTADNFFTSDCDCKVSIIESGKKLEELPLTTVGPQQMHAFYIFPKKGIYQIILTGKSITSQQFDPFEISYEFRVSRTKNRSISEIFTDKKIIAGGIILVIVAGIFFKKILPKFKEKERSLHT